jgi:hypothetical protein
MGIWDQIDYLGGQTLKTLEQHKPFEVMEVTASDIQIYIYSTLKKHRIKRVEIEGAWQELQEEGAITSSDIKNRYSKNSPAYIAAILASLPGVTHRIKPIQLFVNTG